MKWTEEELEELSAVEDQIARDLHPLEGKKILVLCSGPGDVALSLGRRVGPQGQVVGLDLSDRLLAEARIRARESGLHRSVEFRKADMHRIPFPDGDFDALVSEFIVFPAPEVTQIDQPEMARVLKPGGEMVLTDVIVTRDIGREARDQFKSLGLDYLCEATPDDFRAWMTAANLSEVEWLDFTPTVRQIWEKRWSRDRSPARHGAYSLLLEDDDVGLGNALYYIYVRGVKGERP